MRLSLLFVAPLLFISSVSSAQVAFPGIKNVLTESEWKRAGLDRMTPDEIGVIDAALIRHQRLTTSTLQIEMKEAMAAAAAAVAPSEPVEPQKRTLLQRFGFPSSGVDWRTVPPLKAKVVAWESANRFKLENGQVWESSEVIPYDLPGKEIEIHARPNERYTLIVDGQNTTVRITRLR